MYSDDEAQVVVEQNADEEKSTYSNDETQAEAEQSADEEKPKHSYGGAYAEAEDRHSFEPHVQIVKNTFIEIKEENNSPVNRNESAPARCESATLNLDYLQRGLLLDRQDEEPSTPSSTD